MIPFGVLAVLSFFLLWRLPVDTDLWWHLKAGQLMWEQGRIFTTDIFSSTAFGHEWINHEWLTEILFYIFYRWAPWEGLVLLRYLLGLGTLWFMYRTTVLLTGRRWASLFISMVAFYVVSLRLGLRPSTVSTLWIAVSFFLCVGIKTNRFSIYHYAWFPILFLLWANMHGGYIIGLVFLFLFRLPEVAMKRHWFFHPFSLTLFCLLACLANPYGYRLLTFPLEHLGLQAAMSRTVEWQSAFQPVALFFADARWIPYVFVLIGGSFFVSRGAFELSYFLILLLVGILSAKSVRFVSELVVVGMPLMALNLSQHPWFSFHWAQNFFMRRSIVYLFMLILIIPAVLSWRRLGSLRIQEDWLKKEEVFNFSPDVAEFLKANSIAGRIFNDTRLGESLIFFMGPKQKVFIDNRHYLYENSFFENYWKALSSPKVFQDFNSRYGPFDVVLLSPWGIEQQVHLHTYLWTHPEEWALVYFSQKGFIYLRRELRFEDLIRRYALHEPPLPLKVKIPYLKY